MRLSIATSCTVLAAAMFVSGCGESQQPPTSDTHDSTLTHHGHHHVAPHGGTLIELGNEYAILEFVRDKETGLFTCYVLGGEAESSIRLQQESMMIEIADIKKDDQSEPQEVNLTLIMTGVSNPLTGETSSDTSQFEGQLDDIKGDAQFKVTLPPVTIKGQMYSNVSFHFPSGKLTDGGESAVLEHTIVVKEPVVEAPKPEPVTPPEPVVTKEPVQPTPPEPVLPQNNEIVPVDFMVLSNYRAPAPEWRLDIKGPTAPSEKVEIVVPDNVKALNGRIIQLEGFMLPIDNDEGSTGQFILTASFSGCLFCDPAHFNEYVLVTLPKDKQVPIRGLQPVVVTGRFKVDIDAVTSLESSLYQMAGTIVVDSDIKAEEFDF